MPMGVIHLNKELNCEVVSFVNSQLPCFNSVVRFCWFMTFWFAVLLAFCCLCGK